MEEEHEGYFVQDYLRKNPIKKLGLKKRRDEGHIKLVQIADIKTFLGVMKQNTYAGLRGYTATMVMLDTGIRPKELFSLKEADFQKENSELRNSKIVAKTRTARSIYVSEAVVLLPVRLIKLKSKDWPPYIFCTYDGTPFKS